MKRAALIFLLLILILSACACGKADEDIPEKSSSSTVLETVPQEPEVTTDAPSTEADTTVSYDTSAEYSATVIKNGDALTGGTYTATGVDESALEASGSA